MTVGRHPTNDLVVDDAGVSGVHLELARTESGLRIRDVGSKNGTWMGAYRIREIEPSVGAEIVIGDTTLRVEVDEAATSATVSTAGSFVGLVGESAAMREIFALLERVAPKRIDVLVQGDAGTGKEEVARAIVDRSSRARAPFVIVDVPSLSEESVLAVLFGREDPDAGVVERGVFETGAGGTVFVDEIGELPASAQSRLSRLVERRELTRLGGHVPVAVDVRIVAATTRDLRKDIEAGRFREDLFMRLAQVRVVLPALRNRREDIPVLCRTLLAALGGSEPIAIDDDAVAELTSHPWRGNVRELRNALERAAMLRQGTRVTLADVAGQGYGFRGSPGEEQVLDLSGTFRDAKERAIASFEATYLMTLMRRWNGNVTQAARQASMERHHLRDLLKKRGLYDVARSFNED